MQNCEKNLKHLGIQSLIAPPFYWGINVATNDFLGSFTVKLDTLVSILVDIIQSIKNWRFEKIFLLNLHGDLNHVKIIIEASKKPYEEFDGGVYYILPEFYTKIWQRISLNL